MKIKIEELLNIISLSLDVPLKKISIKTKSDDIQEWDSLGQLEIAASLDDKFEGKLNLEKLSSKKSVKEIIAFLKKKKSLF